MELGTFLGDGGGEVASQPPLFFGDLPQMRQVKFGMQIEYLNRRVWGKLGDGYLLANENNFGM